MTHTTHKETARGWALVAQQLAMAIHARQEASAQPLVTGRWYPGAPIAAAPVADGRVLETVR